MAALRRLMPSTDNADSVAPPTDLMVLEVTMDDFLGVLHDIEPSAMRQVFTELPDVTWDQVGGMEEAKAALREAVEWPLRYPELMAAASTRPAKGILLSGAPGGGKTLLARAAAHETGVNFISIKGPELLSKWVGDSEKGIREIYKKARQAAPCIVFLDEIDALAPRRGDGTGNGVAERVVSQLLTEIDGIEETRGVVTLATTNRPDMLDPALMRPGRFDIHIHVPPPDAAARQEILAVHTRNQPLAADVPKASHRAGVVAPYLPEPRDLRRALAGILRRSHLPVALILDASDGVPRRLHGTVPLKTAEGPRDLAPQGGYARSTLGGVPCVTPPGGPRPVRPASRPCPPQGHGRPAPPWHAPDAARSASADLRPGGWLSSRRVPPERPGRVSPPLTLFPAAS